MTKRLVLLLLGAVFILLAFNSCTSNSRDFNNYSIGENIKDHPELSLTRRLDYSYALFGLAVLKAEYCKVCGDFAVIADTSGVIVNKHLSIEAERRRNIIKIYNKWVNDLYRIYKKDAVPTVIVDDEVETNSQMFGLRLMNYFKEGSIFMFTFEGKKESAAITITKNEIDDTKYDLELMVEDNEYLP